VKVTDPLIELLAIKLFEHDTWGHGKLTFKSQTTCWGMIDEEDREPYRRAARGEEPIYGDEEA
jgi:hypothetical protein